MFFIICSVVPLTFDSMSRYMVARNAEVKYFIDLLKNSKLRLSSEQLIRPLHWERPYPPMRGPSLTPSNTFQSLPMTNLPRKAYHLDTTISQCIVVRCSTV